MRFAVDIEVPTGRRCGFNPYTVGGCDRPATHPAVMQRTWDPGQEAWDIYWVCDEHRGGVLRFETVEPAEAKPKPLQLPKVAFDYLAPEPHHCRPPEIITWDLGSGLADSPGAEYAPPTIIARLPDGTTWVCDCGRGWVVHTLPSVVGAFAYVAGGPQWRPERRRERRRRLRAAS